MEAIFINGLKKMPIPPSAQNSIPLDIPQVDVLVAKQTLDGKFLITVESRKETTKCGMLRPCSAQVLPILSQETYIAIRSRRAQCLTCLHNPTTTQELSWHEQSSPHTKAYDQYLMKQLIASTVADASLKEKVGCGAVLGSLQRQVASEVDLAQVQNLGAAGIDEAAHKKGRKSCRAVITARQDDVAVLILAVLNDRNKDGKRFSHDDSRTLVAHDPRLLFRYA